MIRRWSSSIALVLLVSFAGAALAASEADYKAALAAAEAANKQAGALRNQWTTTAQALAAAKKAAEAGKFDEAVREAQRAEALAKASIVQAEEEAKHWRDAVIR
jgi:multidrug resistance efflux pump